MRIWKSRFSAGQKRPDSSRPLSGGLFSTMARRRSSRTPSLALARRRYSLRATGSGTFSISLTTAWTTLPFSSGMAMRAPGDKGVDQEIEPGDGLLHQGRVFVAAVLLEERVGVEAVGQDEDVDVEALLEAERDRPGRRRLPGAVAVVVDDEPRGEAHGLPDLPRRQGRSERGHDVADPGLVERREIRIALDEDGRPFLPDGVLGEIQSVEELALGVEGRLRRIEILRLRFEDRPAAEGDDAARQAEDGEDDPAPEAVAVFARPRRHRQGEAALFEQGHGDVLRSGRIRPGPSKRSWRSRS